MLTTKYIKTFEFLVNAWCWVATMQVIAYANYSYQYYARCVFGYEIKYEIGKYDYDRVMRLLTPVDPAGGHCYRCSAKPCKSAE